MGAWGVGPFASDQGCDLVDQVTAILTGERHMKEVNPADVDQAQVQFVMEQILTGKHSARWADGLEMFAAVGLVALGVHGGRALPPLSEYPLPGAPLLSEATAAALVPQAREALTTLREDEDWVYSWGDPESYLATLDAVDQLLSGDNNAPKEIS
jgi:hypothetical protein